MRAFLLLSFILFSCETTNQGLNNQYQGYLNGQSAEDQARLNRYTDNGTNIIRSGRDMTDRINQVGDVCYECDQAHIGGVEGTVATYPQSLKQHEAPSRGCLPVSEVSLSRANQALNSQNLTTTGATNSETRTAGAAVLWMQHLSGGRLAELMGPGHGVYPIHVQHGSGVSSQGEHQITINRNGAKAHGLSVAQHVHELAHVIGNNGAYPQYLSHMRGHGKCLVSNYSGSSNNEQFAEVLTAFVTEPKIFERNTTAACAKAFEFFKKWFAKGDRVSECM